MLSNSSRFLLWLSRSSSSSHQRRLATTLIVGDNFLSAVTAAQKWTPTHELHLLATKAPTQVPVAISKVFVTNSPLLEVLAEAAVKLAPDNILASHDKQGSTVIPRIAGMKKSPCVTDVMSFQEDDGGTIIRPIYAGNALVAVRINPQTVLTIRPTAFAPNGDLVEVTNVETVETDYSKSTWISEFTGGSGSNSRPDLTSASTVVSGGRALGDVQNFAMLEQLADAIGDAAVGASRAAVDAGMYPNSAQVGQTGKVVAPNLYIAVGISGAIQHVSGMKDSKVIVAINKDSEAPIFQIADYGLAMDLFQAVPEMTEKIRNGKK